MWTNDPYYCESGCAVERRPLFRYPHLDALPDEPRVRQRGRAAGVQLLHLLLDDVVGELSSRRCDFGFCDGSVKFLKNSISSWSFNGGNNDGDGDSLPDYTTLRHGHGDGPLYADRLLLAEQRLTRRMREPASISSSRRGTAARSSAPIPIERGPVGLIRPPCRRLSRGRGGDRDPAHPLPRPLPGRQESCSRDH